jgi:hypothetical protein
MGTSVHVQTFLPYADFARTAEVLDRTRLGKQRVECIQIVRALTIPTYGWRHHPAALMWRGHLEALGAYSFAIVDEWTRRGHADTCAATIGADLEEAGVSSVRSPSSPAHTRCRRGSATRTFTAATNPHSHPRTRRTTVTTSRTCPTGCRTCGRRRTGNDGCRWTAGRERRPFGYPSTRPGSRKDP